MPNEISGDTFYAIEAGKRLGDPKKIDDGAYTVVANGDRVENLERLLVTPRRVRADITAHTIESFVAYFNDHTEDDDDDGDVEKSRIFADLPSFRVHAVLDYHGSRPSWCTHNLTYVAPRSTEWMIWTGKNGRPMPQVEFAQFIEDNVADVRTPPGAELLEIARNLQAKKSVEFSSAVNLVNGARELTYNETVSGVTSKGKIVIPERFVLGIPVFRDDEAYEVIARLRYRINEGRLSFWYDLYRHEAIEADAFKHIVTKIESGTGVASYYGTV